jgi:hypothetical protein
MTIRQYKKRIKKLRKFVKIECIVVAFIMLILFNDVFTFMMLMLCRLLLELAYKN